MKKEIKIPRGYEARIAGNKVIIEKKESDDEISRKQLINEVKEQIENIPASDCCDSDDLQRLTVLQSWLAYLERQKELEDITDVQLMSTHFWKAFLKDSIIPGNKPSKQDIDFLLPIARNYFSLIVKDLNNFKKLQHD